MKRIETALLIVVVLLHLTYIALSFNEEILLALSYDAYAVLIERALMLLQFAPLLVIIITRRLSKNRLLLFLSFAICVNTLYVVSDFQTGFYAAMVNHESGLVPRMRTSAHLMGYKELGRIVILDYHAEYFLEFISAHFVSEVTGMNYILSYAIIMRSLSIMFWSVLFVWAHKSLNKKHFHQPLWGLFLAFGILIANQGYNFEVGFAPILLLLWYMAVCTKESHRMIICSLLITFAIILASFRQTLLLSIVCLFGILGELVMAKIKPSNLSARKSLLTLTFFLLSIARTVQFSSNYVEDYTNKLLSIVDSVIIALRGEGMSREPLITLRGIGSPVDQGMALISVISAVGTMALLSVLSLKFLLIRNRKNAFSSSIPATYILMFAIPLASYSTLIVAGAGGMRDYSSSTVLARSLAPLVILTMINHFMQNKHRNQESGRVQTPIMKLMTLSLMVYLSISVSFAPFLFLRGNVKTSYDMNRVAGDNNENVVTATGVFCFILSHSSRSDPVVVNPSREPATTYFFHIYYSLPLKYRLGENNVVFTKNPTGRPLADVYDNGIYITTYYYVSPFASLVVNQSSRGQ